jgi:hypothetical protein
MEMLYVIYSAARVPRPERSTLERDARCGLAVCLSVRPCREGVPAKEREDSTRVHPAEIFSGHLSISQSVSRPAMLAGLGVVKDGPTTWGRRKWLQCRRNGRNVCLYSATGQRLDRPIGPALGGKAEVTAPARADSR